MDGVATHPGPRRVRPLAPLRHPQVHRALAACLGHGAGGFAEHCRIGGQQVGARLGQLQQPAVLAGDLLGRRTTRRSPRPSGSDAPPPGPSSRPPRPSCRRRRARPRDPPRAGARSCCWAEQCRGVLPSRRRCAAPPVVRATTLLPRRCVSSHDQPEQCASTRSARSSSARLTDGTAINSAVRASRSTGGVGDVHDSGPGRLRWPPRGHAARRSAPTCRVARRG